MLRIVILIAGITENEISIKCVPSYYDALAPLSHTKPKINYRLPAAFCQMSTRYQL